MYGSSVNHQCGPNMPDAEDIPPAKGITADSSLPQLGLHPDSISIYTSADALSCVLRR